MSLFDLIVSRDRTSRKTGQMKKMFGTETVIPLWIADMDFNTPDAILSEMKSVASQPIQGYNIDYPCWKKAVIQWYKKRYNCEVKDEWIHFVPGVIKSVVLSLLALTQRGDNILTLTPIYDPYRDLVPGCERNLIQSRLIEKGSTFEIDWIDFREKLKQCQVFLLVSPHNPGGVVWRKETLSKIQRCCHDENVVIISDEVHCDLVFSEEPHTPFFDIDKDTANQSVILHSSGKTFNVPGVQGGFMIIKNPRLREKLFGFLEQCHLAETNYLQQAVIYSSFTYCEDWYQKLLPYLADNVNFVKEAISKDCPDISVVHGGASYLLFLNATKLGMNDEQLADFFIKDAGLGLSPGKQYGPGGEQHMRLNVAAPRHVLNLAMEKLKAAYKKRHFPPYEK
jgi:cystathionine beta-lyase